LLRGRHGAPGPARTPWSPASLEEEPLERVEGRVGPVLGAEQLVGGLSAEGIDPVAGAAAPDMLVLGAIVHEQKDRHRRRAVEDGLGLVVDPVEVLEDRTSGCTPLSRRRSALMAWRVRRRRRAAPTV
jgi:hypothetical protein